MTVTVSPARAAIAARPGVVLCDYPGCPNPATNVTQAQGANTKPKAWYGCDDHPATPRTTNPTGDPR